MNRFTVLFALLAIPAALVISCSNGNSAEEKKPIEPPKAQVRKSPDPAPGSSRLTAESEVAVIQTKLGSIVIRFFPHAAPNHVKNFKALAKSKFYDGCTFHRVIPGFMIQGGDPNSKDDNLQNDGMGGGPRKLMAEFSQIRHEPGIVSAARSADPNSASSQFFIVVKAAPNLNGQYTVFGKVIKGMEVADKIVALPRDERDNPGKAALIESIRIVKAGDVPDLQLDE